MCPLIVLAIKRSNNLRKNVRDKNLSRLVFFKPLCNDGKLLRCTGHENGFLLQKYVESHLCELTRKYVSILSFLSEGVC